MLGLGSLGEHIVHVATKDAGVGEEQLFAEQQHQDVVDAIDALFFFRLPTSGARSPAQLDHPRTRRSPRLIQDRQSDGDAETLLDADEDHAESGD